jgi:magnesium chelatase family protein
MNAKLLRKYCLLQNGAKELQKMAMTELKLSARAYDKILNMSRTIVDLAGCENIKTECLSEAIQYRSPDKDFFA